MERRNHFVLCLKFNQNESNGATESEGLRGARENATSTRVLVVVIFVVVLELFLLCTRQHSRSIYSIIGEASRRMNLFLHPRFLGKAPEICLSDVCILATLSCKG